MTLLSDTALFVIVRIILNLNGYALYNKWLSLLLYYCSEYQKVFCCVQISERIEKGVNVEIWRKQRLSS